MRHSSDAHWGTDMCISHENPSQMCMSHIRSLGIESLTNAETHPRPTWAGVGLGANAFSATGVSATRSSR